MTIGLIIQLALGTIVVGFLCAWAYEAGQMHERDNRYEVGSQERHDQQAKRPFRQSSSPLEDHLWRQIEGRKPRRWRRKRP